VRIEPEISAVSLVLLGRFNPAIFLPAWFARYRLLTDREADSANLVIANNEVVNFEAEWLHLEVFPSRLQMISRTEPFIRLCDLAVRTFREFLPHTPIRALGINRQVHFRVGSFDARDRIGSILAPKEPWGEWGRLLAASPEKEKRGGMRSLTMTQAAPDGRQRGCINVTVEPSRNIGQESDGISVQVNDHFELQDADRTYDSNEIVGLLEDNFQHSLKRSEKIIDHVMSLK